jgi:aspartate racemase
VTDYSQDSCIHQLFEAQVERTPVATAVVYEGSELTYEELNRRANQLAHHLRKRGVGPEVLVGIYVERSLEMIVGLLGILKAGGAYVPLDLVYPQERLAFMLEDTQVSVLLTQEQLAVRLPMHQAEVIYLDTDWETIAQESTGNPVAVAAPENLACILYTSGSTGKPKGVMIQHQSVVHYTETASVEFALEPSDRVLQFASISFDSSLEEIFPCLSRGATLVLRSEAMADSFSAFLQKCHDLALTVLDLPTGYWHELTTRLGPAERFAFSPSLRLVIIGGERALRERLSAWQQHVGQRVRLINTYGPTEATVVATMCELSGTVEATSREVPIGRAIRNVQTHILDQHLQPVLVGVPGELYIGGAGLARGYLNRPELTAEKFIPHPFSAEPGARLYKTGDLVRYLPDGTLEFLGRIDHQVKIRGFRVELEEIETVLSQHPAVQQVVVVAREDRAGDRRLVAYVVPHQEPVPKVSELRHFVQRQLPDYMVPAAFVWLERLPLTLNGKVDRRALPAPDQTRPELEKAFVAPRDVVELQLTKIWETVLNVKPIGVRDNFFELGGHSLLAVRLCEQIEQNFGKDFSLAMLFQAPTIEQQASILREEGWSAPWTLLVPLQPRGSKPPFFCVGGSGALAHSMDPDQPFYGLRPHGLDGRRVPSTVEDMAADYIKEIRALQPEGPYFLGGFSLGGIAAFEMAQQLRKQGQEVALLVLLDPDSPPNSHFSPPASPSLLNLSTKITLLRDEFARHSCTLALLGPREKLAYVLERVEGKLKKRLKRIERTIKKIACRLSLGIGGRVPSALRMFYFLEAGGQAAQKYVPHVYAGRVILFQSQDCSPDLQLDWGRLATEGLEVYEVSGGHLDIIRGPHIQILGAKLGTCLSETRQQSQVKEA